MGVRRNFSRGGQSRHFAYLFQAVGNANGRIQKNVQRYGSGCIHGFPCKKLYTEQMFVLVSMDISD